MQLQNYWPIDHRNEQYSLHANKKKIVLKKHKHKTKNRIERIVNVRTQFVGPNSFAFACDVDFGEH
jgi:hypothetical protein